MLARHTLSTDAGLRVRTRLAGMAVAAVLLLCAGNSTAATLYRWLEPDGTPTFSPKPPPAGIDYTTVDTASMSSTKDAVSQAAAASGNPSVQQQAAVPAVRTPAAVSEVTDQAVGLNYAPAPGSSTAVLDSGITAGTDRGNAVSAADEDAGTSPTPQAITAANNKRARCEELEKRVVSLERRLRSPLTAEDMDNTVIHMARYQQNVNRFCQS